MGAATKAKTHILAYIATVRDDADAYNLLAVVHERLAEEKRGKDEGARAAMLKEAVAAYRKSLDINGMQADILLAGVCVCVCIYSSCFGLSFRPLVILLCARMRVS